jgi:hypothetical protein
MELTRITITLNAEGSFGTKKLTLTEFTPDDLALIGQLVGEAGAGAEQAIIDAFDGAITQMLGSIAANAQMKLLRDRRRAAQQLRGA